MSDPRYAIDTTVRFDPLVKMDVRALAAAMQPWSNQTLCRVNDSVVRLGVIDGEFHWHKHEREDEFFHVIEGALEIELRDRTPVRLGPGTAFVVPRGVEHLTRAIGRTVIVMVESATVVPTGD